MTYHNPSKWTSLPNLQAPVPPERICKAEAPRKRPWSQSACEAAVSRNHAVMEVFQFRGPRQATKQFPVASLLHCSFLLSEGSALYSKVCFLENMENSSKDNIVIQKLACHLQLPASGHQRSSLKAPAIKWILLWDPMQSFLGGKLPYRADLNMQMVHRFPRAGIK